MTVDDAYRFLDLDANARLKDVVEARDDLLALWNPERLGHAPRLRSRAPEKIREIQAAYETLMEHLGEPGGAGGAQTSTPAAASLYEEVFAKSKSPVPLWLIVVLAVVVIAAALYLIPTGQPANVVVPGPVVDSPTKISSEPAEPPADGATQPEPVAVPDQPSGASQPTPTLEPVVTPRPAAAAVEEPSRQGPKPLLQRREIGTAESQEHAEAERQKEQELRQALAAAAEKAYQKLVSDSAAARRLVQGEILGQSVSERQIVQQTNAEVWLDLVAVRSGGKPTHYIWAVPLAEGKPRPLSEAARDLEGGKPQVGASN